MERRTVLALLAGLALGAGARAGAMKPLASAQFRTEWLENMRRYSAIIHYPLREPAERYPFLIFAPGMGKVAGDYEALLEALASQGFVVAAVRAANPVRGATEADYAAMEQEIFAMARRMPVLARERGNPLAGRINLNGYGVLGHSLGGAAALMAAAHDDAVRAAMNLDGDLVGEAQELRPRQPLGTLMSEKPMPDNWLKRWGEARSEKRRDAVWKETSRRAAATFRARLGGMQHGDFATGSERQIAMAAALTAAFFAGHLDGSARSPKDVMAPVLRAYPEAVIQP